MIAVLDSAYAPSVESCQAAYAGGVRNWGGYIASRFGVGLLNPWSKADFDRVRFVFGCPPIAYCSGWDDPAALKALAAAWGVRLCLDIESGIRDDGPWVDGFLAASGAGLYGLLSVHTTHSAAFHVVADYIGRDPRDVWPLKDRPAAPLGWQWSNSHDEFGVGVDRCWFDDWFAAPASPAQGEDMTPDEHQMLQETHDKVNQMWADYVAGPRSSGHLPDELAALDLTPVLAALHGIPAAAPVDLAPVLAAIHALPAAPSLQPVLDAIAQVKGQIAALPTAQAPTGAVTKDDLSSALISVARAVRGTQN